MQLREGTGEGGGGRGSTEVACAMGVIGRRFCGVLVSVTRLPRLVRPNLSLNSHTQRIRGGHVTGVYSDVHLQTAAPVHLMQKKDARSEQAAKSSL